MELGTQISIRDCIHLENMHLTKTEARQQASESFGHFTTLHVDA